MIEKKTLEALDWQLLLTILALSLVGLTAIYSSTQTLHSRTFLWQQCAWIVLGFLVCAITIKIDYHTLTDFIAYLYVPGLLLLLGLLLFGREINGSKSWLDLGVAKFQPSEVVKFLTVIMLARFLSGVRGDRLSNREMLTAASICLVPMVLVVLQGDLGTALTYGPIAGVMMFLVGIPRRAIVAGIVLVALLIPIGWFSLKTYQKQRILATFQPESDPKGIGYQARQSKIGLGSGGFAGKGFMKGSQSRLGFIPEQQTDFVFSGLTEERGLLGALITLGLYSFLLMRSVNITRQARDRVGILIVMGVVTVLTVHLIINVGMVTGLLPVIGIPLPLLSYGGSSYTSTLFGLGLILSVELRRYVN